MQMMEMYIDEEETSRRKRLSKIVKTVGVILWVVMIAVSIFLTSRSIVVIN